MKNADFLAMLKKAADETKTLYVMGGFGAPANAKNKKRYSTNHDYNIEHASEILAASADTFFFDCSGMVKGIINGWCADVNATYGGAIYNSVVPDISTDSMIEACPDASDDFSKIEAGELLWMEGHVGVYMGNGLAIECTPAWQNDVQWTAVLNIGKKSGYNGRKWTRHGHMPWIEYEQPQKFQIGQLVNFKGHAIYGSASSTMPWGSRRGLVVIADYKSGALHPYKIKGTGINGYCDENELETYKPVNYTESTSRCSVSLPMIQQGNKGEAVKTLKVILNAHGAKLNTDENFDDATAEAVKATQKAAGLTVDGIVGVETWRYIISG